MFPDDLPAKWNWYASRDSWFAILTEDSPKSRVKELFANAEETLKEADKALHPEASYRHIDERGWRRLAASPDPKKIVEADSILNLLDNDFVVIACGGGGLPVVRDYSDKGAYKGVPAVIEKDLAGELLAEDCHANVLLMITSVMTVASSMITRFCRLGPLLLPPWSSSPLPPRRSRSERLPSS